MDNFVRWFIKASLTWLGVGVLFGLCMALYPELIIYRPAHAHMNLLGFVTMMIFGVGYHVLPRIAGAPLRWPGLGVAHWWLSNLGLLLMVTGFFLLPAFAVPGRAMLGIGGGMAVTGVFFFIINIWRTIDVASARAASAVLSRRNALPVREAIV